MSFLILVTDLLSNRSRSVSFLHHLHHLSAVPTAWHIPSDIHFGLQVNPNEISRVILPCKAKLSLISLSHSICCFFCYWFQCLNGYSAFNYCTRRERHKKYVYLLHYSVQCEHNVLHKCTLIDSSSKKSLMEYRKGK